MKPLSNFLSFVLFLAIIGTVVYLLFPRIDEALPPFEDVPVPSELHPVVEERRDRLVQLAEEKGIDLVITEGHRSEERQDALYEQGRSNDGRVVTNARAGESYHNYGLAIDFALRTENGEVVWDMNRDGNGNGESDWMEVVAIAKDLGFEWGGDWSNFKDYPHLQMDFGLSIRELQWGKRPEVAEQE
ncbi:M15 family peptidase [Halobacillus fulvus]|nr:M15 family peptidase [Halobacillus fulvus]